MTWTKPEEPIADARKAIVWWLKQHFTKALTTKDASWAMDLYASYLDASVETRMMPIITAAMFGRIVGDLAPRTGYRCTTIGGQRKSGYQYMLAPLDGVPLFVNAACKSGPRELAKLHSNAKSVAGGANSWEWSVFEDLSKRDKRVVQDWLAARGMKADPNGEPKPTKLLFDEFVLSYPWSLQRFNKVLAKLSKVRRGENGARKVVLIQQLEATDGGRQVG